MSAPRCGKCPGCRGALAAVGDGSTRAERAERFPCKVWPDAYTRQLDEVSPPVDVGITRPRLGTLAAELEAALERSR